MRILSHPGLYFGWTIFVVAMLTASYFYDPYVFGFSTFALGAASAIVFALACIFVFPSAVASRSAKLAVLTSVVASLAVVLIALAILESFHWA